MIQWRMSKVTSLIYWLSHVSNYSQKTALNYNWNIVKNLEIGINLRRLVFCIVVALLTTGCSNRAIYNSVQLNNTQRCQELPIPQQTACQAQYQTSFDEYQREREELTADSISRL